MKRISYWATAMFLLSATSIAAPRDSRKFGIFLEGYKGNFGIIHLGLNALETLRINAGYGSNADKSFKVFGASIKWIPLRHNLSPFIGANFWSFKGSISGIEFKGSEPGVSGGLDLTLNVGLNLGGGVAYLPVSKSTLGHYWLGWYF